jgi:hypothetical protein
LGVHAVAFVKLSCGWQAANLGYPLARFGMCL